MKTLSVGNMQLKYNESDWNEHKAKFKDVLNTALIVLAVCSFVLWFIVITKVGISMNHIGICMTSGLIVGMLSLILVETFAEHKLFRNEIAGYKVITWLHSLDRNTTVTCKDKEIEVNTPDCKFNLTKFFSSINCNYMVSYGDKIQENNPKIIIDATDKSIVNVNVE